MALGCLSPSLFPQFVQFHYIFQHGDVLLWLTAEQSDNVVTQSFARWIESTDSDPADLILNVVGSSSSI